MGRCSVGCSVVEHSPQGRSYTRGGATFRTHQEAVVGGHQV